MKKDYMKKELAKLMKLCKELKAKTVLDYMSISKPKEPEKYNPYNKIRA